MARLAGALLPGPGLVATDIGATLAREHARVARDSRDVTIEGAAALQGDVETAVAVCVVRVALVARERLLGDVEIVQAGNREARCIGHVMALAAAHEGRRAVVPVTLYAALLGEVGMAPNQARRVAGHTVEALIARGVVAGMDIRGRDEERWDVLRVRRSGIEFLVPQLLASAYDENGCDHDEGGYETPHDYHFRCHAAAHPPWAAAAGVVCIAHTW